MFDSYQDLFLNYLEFYSDSFLATNSTFSQPIKSSNGDLHLKEFNAGECALNPDLGSRQLDEYGQEIIIGSFNGLKVMDLITIVAIFVNFVYLKRHLSLKLKQSTFLDQLGLRAKDREKLNECLWRLGFYAFSSIWLIYSCFLRRKSHMYLRPNYQIAAEYSFQVDLDEYLICMIEIGFYLHAIYAILFEDIWRRDSPMVIIHHLAAIFSFVSLYATRTHRIGLIAVTLRDTCDVLLEAGKLNMSLKVQHGKVVKNLDLSLKFAMVLFTACFIVNQLYYYPLFCLYHALEMMKVHKLKTPAITGIITCAFLFLVLDLFWFLLILRLLIRMILSPSRPLTDVREYDDSEEERELKRLQGGAFRGTRKMKTS